MNKSVISRPMGGFTVEVEADFMAGAPTNGPRLVAVGRRCCGGFERVKVRNGRGLSTVTCTCVAPAESRGAAA